MIKNKLIQQQKGSISVYAIATILCFITILGAIFLSSASIRKNQLKTMFKIKEIYSANMQDADKIEANRKKIDTSGYVQDSSLQVFYDSINNMGTSHNNNTNIWRDLSANKNDAIKKGNGALTWESNAYNFTTQNTNYFESKKPISLGTSSRTIEIVFTLEEDGVRNLAGFGTLSNCAMTDLYYFPNVGLNWHIHGNRADEGIGGGLAIGKTYAVTIAYDGATKKTDYYTNATSKTGVSFYNLNTGSSTLTIGIGKYTIYNTNKRFKIKSIRIYNKVLTPAERAQNYQLDKARYVIAD